jgi:NAD(P)-dependent dehydrogenase (short-subunit alcohol dehydrogenase family)
MNGRPGRVAVVTGGGSGVGRAVVEHLAAAGHRVAILDVDRAAAEQVAASFGDGHRVIAEPVDVSDRAAVEQAYAEVRRQLGPIEILVTSAAISGFVPFEQITPDDWQRTIDIDLTGTFHSIQLAIGDMVERGWGRVVTISSAAGQTGSERQGHYSAAKGGVIALTKTVAREYARKGITANSVPPFVTDTPMLRAAQDAGYLPGADVLARMIPAGRLGTPDDIGATVAFLCSEAAGYITGQVIGVNGGAVL